MRQYLDLLKIPGVKRLILSGFPGRFAYGMIQLATFFYVKEVTGSITIAGFATGLATISSALTAGFRGAIMDRFGQFRPLITFVPGWVLMVFLLTLNDSQTWVLVLSTLFGLFSPPINLATRPLWRDAVGAANLRTAYAIDTTVMNATTVIGPVVATYLAITYGGFAALWMTSAMMAIGGLAMITMPLSRNWIPEKAEANAKALWRHRGYQMIIIEGMLFGFAWGLMEITIPSYSTFINRPELSAPLLSTLAFTSIIGGLVIGGRKTLVTPLRGFKISGLIVGLVSIPLAFTKPGILMGIVLAVIGLAIGFAQVFHWETLEAIRPAGSATSAQAWLWTIEGTMLAFGAALGGYLVEQVNPAFALALISIGLLSATGFIWLYGSRHLVGADRPLSEVEKVAALADLESPLE